jgi:hypothetical protein
MDDSDKFKEEEKVDPADKTWFLAPPSARQEERLGSELAEEKVDEAASPDEAPEEKLGAEEEGEEGDEAGLISKGSTIAKLKGGAAAGKIVAGMASGYAKKTQYFEGNADRAVEVVNKVASALNKAGYAFPPMKIVTAPLSSAIGGVNKVRKGVRVAQLLADKQGRPLTLAQLSEAAEKLDEIPRTGLLSDQEDNIERAQEALWAMRTKIEQMLEGLESEGEESKSES